ncbi:MAG: substrate-binding domain-containing protein [Planctomycetota bacterium]|nr:substrate-binding domain-containing protein [Planctomycetota bacterium]
MQKWLVPLILIALAAIVIVVVVNRKADNMTPTQSGATTQPSGGEGGAVIAWYGMKPHPYINEVQKGVDMFIKDTGTPVAETVGQEWTQANENQNVESLSTKGYKGFSIFPGDASGCNALFAELKQHGQMVVAYGGEPQLPTPALFTVATDIKGAAMAACEQLIKSMGGKGNILNVLERVTDVNTKLRDDGVKEVVAKHPGVSIIETINDVPEVADATTKIQSALAARGADIDGIITTGYNPTVAAAQILTEWHKDSSHKVIHFIGIDTDPVVIQAIKDGAIDATVAQNPHGHSYISCMLLKLMTEGWTPKQPYQFVNAGIVIVTKDNLDTYTTEVQKITDSVLGDLKAKYLDQPK